MICQVAASAALDTKREWLQTKHEQLKQVRVDILSELDGIGSFCRVPRPQGAFYVLLQLDTVSSDMELVHQLVRDFGVAVLPGSTFGVDSGCALRISYGDLARDRGRGNW